MKYLLVGLSGITEIICFLIYVLMIKKSEKYYGGRVAGTEKAVSIDFENSKNKDYIEVDNIKSKINKNEIIEIGIFTILGCIISAFVSGNVNSYIDFVKLMMGYIGLVIAANVDYKVKLIPNTIILVLFGTRTFLVIFEYIFEREDWIYSIGSSILSAIIVFVVLFILSVVSKSGLGMGDVKLLTALAFLCGIYSVLNTMIVALIVCVLVAMVLILSKKKKVKDKIPFGPFLLIGYIITMCLGAY